MDERVNDPCWLKTEYEERRRSIRDIAHELGCGNGTVESRLVRFGIQRRLPGTHVTKRVISAEMRARMSANAKQWWDEHPEAKPVRIEKVVAPGLDRGYRNVHINGKQMREHRAILEGVLGRPLRSDEVVHHINGDTADNRLENLQIMSPTEHSQFHANLDEWRYNDHRPRKLTDEQVIAIRSLWDSCQMSQHQIAKEFDISVGHVCNLVNRKRRVRV